MRPKFTVVVLLVGKIGSVTYTRNIEGGNHFENDIILTDYQLHVVLQISVSSIISLVNR
jgi:hypothetical protein